MRLALKCKYVNQDQVAFVSLERYPTEKVLQGNKKNGIPSLFFNKKKKKNTRLVSLVHFNPLFDRLIN